MRRWIAVGMAGAVVLVIGGQAAAQLRQPRASSLFPSAQASSASPTIQSGQSTGFSQMKPGQNSEINPQPLPPGGKRNGVAPKPSRLHLALAKLANPGAAPSAVHARLVSESHSEAAALRTGTGHVRQEPGSALVAMAKDGIGLVNRRASGVTVTPGGQYVIAGRGFGDKAGQVRLIDRNIPQGGLDFVVYDWHADAITVDLPTAISGVPDLSDAILQVRAADGTLYSKSDIAFYAARGAPMDYTTADPRVAHLFSLAPGAGWALTGAPFPAERYMTGDDINCPSPGTDQVDLDLKPGWTWTSAWVIQETAATGDPNHDVNGRNGDIVVSGSYSLELGQKLTAPYNRFDIGWGVWRTHSGQGGPGAAFGTPDECESRYDLGVTLVGPAGTSPF